MLYLIFSEVNSGFLIKGYAYVSPEFFQFKTYMTLDTDKYSYRYIDVTLQSQRRLIRGSCTQVKKNEQDKAHLRTYEPGLITLMVTSLSAIRTVTEAWGTWFSVILSTLTISSGSTELPESWSSKRYKIIRKSHHLLFILVLNVRYL